VVPLVAAGFALLWSVGHLSATPAPNLPFQQVFASVNTGAPPAYRAFRRLDAGIPGSTKQGWLEAWTEFQPGRGFTFDVTSEGGHEYVRNKVLRNLLKSEQELLARGKPLRAALEARNYEFEDGGLTEAGLQRVVLKPVRKSDGIVNGILLYEPEAGYVSRIEGRLLKSPSFWVRDVDVTWKYAKLSGHVLPVEMTTVGRVRLFGRSTFRMTYDYASIDGRPANARLSAESRDQR
jgi:hypothetical protein